MHPSERMIIVTKGLPMFGPSRPGYLPFNFKKLPHLSDFIQDNIPCGPKVDSVKPLNFKGLRPTARGHIWEFSS